ncbi:hypothetical protein [Companilactobacillus ginsenosidimutans]|uniref:Uncharacterized protein n=1 Tax=Companilactobacillus ginsenosidimutans TaxID=1007676 RepID=A0A0H4R1K5_9LACO|nr:hypothetical protein [Companilactobacillus ginsenosidimutans]AKP67615.1 hypothetical protein ABM34_08780 [Companilactobacillus ginsenosidimutans]
MSNRSKTLISIGSIIVIILIGYFSYQSYSNISVKNSNPAVSQKSKTNKKKIADAETTKKRGRKDTNDNVFLQDKNNPDRIIAIHPFGSNGVYQYRRQSNGNLYPEFKFFDAKISRKVGQLKVHSTGDNAKSFNYKTDSKGNYIDVTTGKVMTPLEINKHHSNRGDIMTAHTSNNSNKGSIVYQDSSNPQGDHIDNSHPYFTGLVHLANGDFIDTRYSEYLGNNYNPKYNSKYADKSIVYDDNHINDVMYYAQNDTTDVSNEDIGYVTDWNAVENEPIHKFDNGIPVNPNINRASPEHVQTHE